MTSKEFDRFFEDMEIDAINWTVDWREYGEEKVEFYILIEDTSKRMYRETKKIAFTSDNDSEEVDVLREDFVDRYLNGEITLTGKK